MSQPPPTEPRPHCYRCDKPQSMCVCEHLSPISNAVGVHILQHPREQRHPLGTTRLLRLGLASVQVHVLGGHGRGVACEPVPLPEGAGLLYPGEDARELSTLQESERPPHLVVIDGTWPQANRIYKDNPWLWELPHYRIDPEQESRYRIRTEPRAECLSTMESVVLALRTLQPDLQGTEGLIAAMDAMIDAQIEASARPSTHARGKRQRVKVSQCIPPAMRTTSAHIVVVYAEAAPIREGVPRSALRLCAVSLDGESVFDQLLNPGWPLKQYEVDRLGLDLEPGDIEGEPKAEEALTAFRAFCQGEDPASLVLASWGSWTHRWLQQSLPEESCVLLKGVWSNLTHARVPELELLLDSLDLEAPELPVPGRAGPRLSQALAMARHIRTAHAR